MKITTLTTNGDVQTILWRGHPEILHQFDWWEFGKSVEKNLMWNFKKQRLLTIEFID